MSGDSSAAPNRAKATRGRFIVAIVLFIALAGIAAVGLIATIAWKGAQGAQDRVEAYLRASDRGDFQAAYNMTTEHFKAASSLQDFVAVQEIVRARLGKYKSGTLGNVQVTTGTGTGLRATALYKADFSLGSAALTFVLDKTGGNWLIERVDYKSAALVEGLKCRKCGTINDPSAKFCKQCGERVR